MGAEEPRHAPSAPPTRTRPLWAAQQGGPAGSGGRRPTRHYKDSGGKILEITDTIYPADRVSVAFQLKRSRGPALGL